MTRPGSTCAQAGQAAVEAALTLPLTVFLVLGCLQLFMMLQARILAQHAAYKAVRAGSLNSGDCVPMEQAAVASLLPTITDTHDLRSLAAAYGARRNNRYDPARDGGHDGQIVELVRERPNAVPSPEDFDFDQPRATAQIQRLELRMVYWYRLRVPFADWVMGKMFEAYFGLAPYRAADPLMLARHADWTATTTLFDEGDWPGGSLAGNLRGWSHAGHYLFPIKVSSVMKMMTPPAARFFSSPACPLP